MKTPESRKQLEQLAEEIFGLSNLASRVRARARGSAVEMLTETEHLTLDMLERHGAMTVGQIQKGIGVLPAQMSRIIRALEDKSGSPFIECAINPDDRRKIDVALTAEGRKALASYQSARIASILGILSILDPAERDDFMRILRKIRDNMAASLERSAVSHAKA
jgi:DNA-binding MarR family transcriptional regulator